MCRICRVSWLELVRASLPEVGNDSRGGPTAPVGARFWFCQVPIFQYSQTTAGFWKTLIQKRPATKKNHR